MMMKRLIAIVFILVLAGVAVAQNPSVFTTIIDDFRGLVGGAPTDLAPTLPMDIMNFDFHTSGIEGGPVSIRKRSGFETVGEGKEGSTGGVYRYMKRGFVDPQLLATFGRDLYFYSSAQNDWVNAARNPLACSCKVTNGDDTIRGLQSAWWIPSTQTYDTIVIGAIRYLIRKIYSDSLLIIADTGYLAATSDAVPCTLVGVGLGISTSPFENANRIKPGIVYNDSLYIFTETERVAYGGGMAASLVAATKVDSLGLWRRTDMTIPVFVKLPLVATGSWVQLQIRDVPKLNIALIVAEKTPTMVRLRCDTNVVKKLYFGVGTNLYAQILPTPSFGGICSTTVTSVTKESLFVEYRGIRSVQDVALCTLSQVFGVPFPLQPVGLYVTRTRTESYPVYIFRYKVRTSGSGCTASAWPEDSLTWMTSLAVSWAGNYRSGKGLNTGDSGYYNYQIPVMRDSDATGPYLAFSTMGVAGGITSLSTDSTAWRTSGLSCTLIPWLSCSPIPQYYTCTYPRGVYTPTSYSMLLRTWGGNDWMIFTTGCVQSSIKNPVTNCSGIASNVSLCSLVVKCYSPRNSITTFTDRGTMAFDATDSFVVRKMTRAARPTLVSSIKTWTNWDYPIAMSLMDRIWVAGASGYPNLISATFDTAPGRIDVGTQVNVYEDDGSYITALWSDQNILFAGKPIGIFSIPIQTTGTEALEPAGCYPTRSTVGPLSQNGIAKTPYGMAFVGFDGVFIFDGSNSDLLSGTMTDFWRDSLDAASLSLGTVVYDYGKNRLMVSVTQKGQMVNSTTLVYDLTAKAWTRYSIGARFWSVMSYPTDKPVLYFGAPDQSTGRICRMADVPSDSGVSFISRWRSGWMPLGGRLGERANLWEWMLEMKRSPNTTVALNVYQDGSNTASHTGYVWGKSQIEAATIAGSPYPALSGPLTGDTLSLWTTKRNGFPAGLGAERFSFSLEVYPTDAIIAFWQAAYGIDALSAIPIDDSCEISGLRIDAVPEGKSPW